MNLHNNPKAQLLLRLAAQAPKGLMVEIGCVREEKEVFEDGFSTPYLAQFAKENKRKFLSFDIDRKCVDICNKILVSYNLPPLVEQADGCVAIKELGVPISFLFLDSHRHPDFSLRQYIQANLVPGAIVVVDDAMQIDNFEFGKAHYIKAVLDNKGIPYSLVDTQPGWKTLYFTLPEGKQSGEMM